MPRPVDTAIYDTPPFLLPEVPEPFSSRVEVDLAALTHQGLVRSGNEDSYIIYRTSRMWERLHTSLSNDHLPRRFEENAYLLAVADGMGGHQAGEVASQLAIRTGVALVLNAAQWAMKLDHPEARESEIEEAVARGSDYFRRIHQALADQSMADPALSRMGTTLTVSYSVGDDLFVLHVGDSRAYLYRSDMLDQITRDHTVVQTLVDAGTITPEQAQGHRLRHVLTRVLGGGAREAHAEVSHRQLMDGDCLLVCSDGLTSMVPDTEIAAILRLQLSAERTCQTLIDAALAAGGRDNVTVALGRYRIPRRGS
ncbi:MAG: protein phosphatase 2C domain-containing protein [Gemmataceae bacterium]